MRKLQRPIDAIIAELIDWIKHSNLSQSEISKKSGVDQSTISRILKAGSSRKSLTSPLQQLCNYAKIDIFLEKEVHPETSKVLMNALESVWDGTPIHAKRLANVIKQIGKLGC